ncbi:hypothetical protein ACHAXR_013324 [Thalassiosira sp. AJA248-18]
MYSTKSIHKNINPHYRQGYTTIGDPYNGNNDKLPSRWKEKQFVTQKFPKNADNGLFVKQKYNSEPYNEISEKARLLLLQLAVFISRSLSLIRYTFVFALHQYSKTQPLPNRKLGFGSRDASKTGEFTCWKTTERYRSLVKQENKLVESHRNEGKEKEIIQRLPKGAPLPPKDRDGKCLDMPMFMYDIGRTSNTWSRDAYDPKSTRDCFYNLPKHAKGEIRRLGGHRPSSAVVGQYAWKHNYGRPEHGSTNGCEKFYDRGHLEVSGF